MKKTTPSGTRTFSISSPLGRMVESNDLADRLGQRGDLFQPVGHRLDPRRREPQAVDLGVGEPDTRAPPPHRPHWPPAAACDILAQQRGRSPQPLRFSPRRSWSPARRRPAGTHRHVGAVLARSISSAMAMMQMRSGEASPGSRRACRRTSVSIGQFGSWVNVGSLARIRPDLRHPPPTRTPAAPRGPPHVVHAEDLHALPGQAKRDADGGLRAIGSFVAEQLARERSSANGRPGSGSRDRAAFGNSASSARLCSAVLPKPMPGSRQIRCRGDAGGFECIARDERR